MLANDRDGFGQVEDELSKNRFRPTRLCLIRVEMGCLGQAIHCKANSVSVSIGKFCA